MKWLTQKSRLKQSDKKGKWILSDNELYMDDDGSIYLTPRNYLTDNFTIPNWVAWIAGSKSEWDVRPSHLHDFGCQYHQVIKVCLSENKLRELHLLRDHKGDIVCEDIPLKYLELMPVTKWEIDCMFKRAMISTKAIPPVVYNLFRSGVFFNIGWLGKHPAFDLNKIYTVEQ